MFLNAVQYRRILFTLDEALLSVVVVAAAKAPNILNIDIVGTEWTSTLGSKIDQKWTIKGVKKC